MARRPGDLSGSATGRTAGSATGRTAGSAAGRTAGSATGPTRRARSGPGTSPNTSRAVAELTPGESHASLLRFPGIHPEADRLVHDPARRSDVDPWGRSERARKLARRVGSFYYRDWFRVEWQGLGNIPTTGGALLVANHAGAIPSDAPMIMHGIEEELGRRVYGLADNWFRTIPAVGTVWSRMGGVPAHPDNAHRLLHDDRSLALVFPEGAKGPSKLVGERYKLRRFGRGGFVETAMRAGVPVVPIAVIGAEESMPIVYRVPGAAKALKVPYLPITANHLLMGPVLGSLVYLPAKFRFRVLEPVHFDVAPLLEHYPRGRIMDEAEAIRQKLQESLYEMLAARRSIWFG